VAKKVNKKGKKAEAEEELRWVTNSGAVITEEIAEQMAEDFEKNLRTCLRGSGATSAVPLSVPKASPPASASAFHPISTRLLGPGPTKKGALSANWPARLSTDI